MNRTMGSWSICAIGTALALLIAGPTALAQNVTTGNLSGTVTDPQGGVLPGVTVTATHEPTGTKYEGVTTAEGRFQMPAVRVGGPYTVTAALSGFRDKTESDVTVGLGEARTVDFKLSLATVTETITIVGEAPVIDTTRAGTASNVKREVIENLPTISRSITDVARTSPYFNESNTNGGDSFLSVAGRNNRYNNIQIDGAVNNDLFGLAASGTPGGQTGVQPISYDALGEIQLVVAPYDVRQGGFSGGSINAVTKSGSNQLNGTGYFYSRSESLVGQIASTFSTDKTKVGLFNDRQGGASLGGPIVQNKAFFFANVDIGRKKTPNGFSVSGTTGQPWTHQDEVNRIIAIAKGYGYDPGSTDEFSKRGNNQKVFIRTDFNLSP
jgi:Carboxypeptidase regulatory-like domain/TonB-dependent Receptor Plug Domain